MTLSRERSLGGSQTQKVVLDYPQGHGLAVCVGTSVRVWNTTSVEEQDMEQGSTGNSLNEDSTVSIDTGLMATAAAWNRNNKVVAVGLENGTVQIRYAHGAYMSTLGGGPSSTTSSVEKKRRRAVCDLSWSSGSKTLAVGSIGGQVEIHNMTQKTFSTHQVYKENIDRCIGVQHHPDDAFLAIGGSDVHLHTLGMDQHHGTCVCSASVAVKNDVYFPSVSVGTGKPYIASGSDKNGIVAVWDYTTQTELACDKFRHAHKGPCKVALAPLEPYLLYSVGMDGLIKMQDLRSPSSIASPTAIASVSSSSVSSLSIHEHSGNVAVGSSDGNVYIFKAGLTSRKPINTIYFGKEEQSGKDLDRPIVDMSWQHNFHNISMHARERVAASEDVSPRRHQSLSTRIDPPVRERNTSSKQQLPQQEEKEMTVEKRQESGSAVSGSRSSGQWRIRARPNESPSTPQSVSMETKNEESTLPKKTPFALNTDKMKKGVPSVQKATATDDGTDVSQLILAMHLDMVNMFEEQQRSTNDMIKQIIDRQDALARDVHDLKQTLHALLTKRDQSTWL